MDTAQKQPQNADARTPVTIPDEDAWIDEALAPMHEFIASLAASSDRLEDETIGVRAWMESLRVSLPWEMDALVDDNGRVHLAAAPPTQYTETTVLPVFHQLTLHVTPLTPDG